jgi:hypothetical protein
MSCDRRADGFDIAVLAERFEWGPGQPLRKLPPSPAAGKLSYRQVRMLACPLSPREAAGNPPGRAFILAVTPPRMCHSQRSYKEVSVGNYLHYSRSRLRLHVRILLLGWPLCSEASRHRRQAALDNQPGTGGESQVTGPAAWHRRRGCFLNRVRRGDPALGACDSGRPRPRLLATSGVSRGSRARAAVRFAAFTPDVSVRQHGGAGASSGGRVPPAP